MSLIQYGVYKRHLKDKFHAVPSISMCCVPELVGIKLYHTSLKLLKSYESKMKVVDGGVEEIFDDSTSKVYETTSEKCNCSNWFCYHSPCRHVLHVRKSSSQDLFSES